MGFVQSLLFIRHYLNKHQFCTLSKKKKMVQHLTKEAFLEKVFNYEKNNEWKFEGNRPCLIDFYADWCGPCKIVTPVLDQLSKDYEGTIDFYKVDTEEELELAAAFGIRNIPSFLFIPVEKQPQMAIGALPRETFIKAFGDVLGVEKQAVRQK
jgi:thioredoxin